MRHKLKLVTDPLHTSRNFETQPRLYIHVLAYTFDMLPHVSTKTARVSRYQLLFL